MSQNQIANIGKIDRPLPITVLSWNFQRRLSRAPTPPQRDPLQTFMSATELAGTERKKWINALPCPLFFFSSFVWFLLYIEKQLLFFQHSFTKHSFSTYTFQHKVGDFGVSYKNEWGMTSSFKDSKMSKQPVQVPWQHWEEVNTGIAFPEVRSAVYFNVVQGQTLQPKDSNSVDFFYKETIKTVSKIHTEKVIPALFPAVVKSSAHIQLQRTGG